METTLVRKKATDRPVWKTVVHYCIPVQNLTPDWVYKRIKSPEYVYVSENKFIEDDWVFLQKWICNRKIKINHLVFRALTVSSENVKYIREILNSHIRIEMVTFNNFSIQNDEVFEDFCSIMKDLDKIHGIKITTNNLSNEHLVKLKSSIDQSVKEVELIHEPTYFASTYEEIGRMIRNKRRFIIIQMKELDRFLEGIAWSLISAIKNSPTITSVNMLALKDLSTEDLEAALDAVAQNKSITQLKLNVRHIIASQSKFRRLIQSNGIKHITIAPHDESFSVPDLVDTLTQPSLTSLTLYNMDKHLDVLLLNIPNIVQLEVRLTQQPNKLAEYLAFNRQPKKLQLVGGTYTKFNELRHLLTNQLTSLMLENVVIQQCDICQILKDSASITELSIIKDTPVSYPENIQQFYDNLADILAVNSTIKRLTLNISGLKEHFYDDFIEGLKENKSLKYLHIRFFDVKLYDSLAEALLENDTLRSINLDGPDMIDTEARFVSEFADVFMNNKSLTSFASKGARCWTTVIPALKHNSTLRTLNLSSMFMQDMTNFLEITSSQSLTALNLTSPSDIPLEIEKKIQEHLRRNYIVYTNEMNSRYSLITMMRLRPEAFLSVFPLEIWLMILKQLQFGHIDLCEKLIEALSNNVNI